MTIAQLEERLLTRIRAGENVDQLCLWLPPSEIDELFNELRPMMRYDLNPKMVYGDGKSPGVLTLNFCNASITLKKLEIL